MAPARKVVAIQFNGDALVRQAYPFVTVSFSQMLPLAAPEPGAAIDLRIGSDG